MVDERLVDAFRVVAHDLEHALDLAFDLLVIGDLVQRALRLLDYAKGEGGVQLVDELGPRMSEHVYVDI